jgi:hypothetical protein
MQVATMRIDVQMFADFSGGYKVFCSPFAESRRSLPAALVC